MTPGMGEGLGGGLPRAAMIVAMAARGELAGGREWESRGLGLVEEGIGTLTVKPIELWWTGYGDRRVSCALCRNRGGANWRGEEDERQSCGRAGWLDELRMAMESGWGYLLARRGGGGGGAQWPAGGDFLIGH